MESLRLLRQQSIQQFVRTRPFRTNLQQLRLQSKHTYRTFNAASKLQSRSLHTRVKPNSVRHRAVANSYRPKIRQFATAAESQTQSLTLSQKLKKLSREYGWSAVGVYFLLSAADFPFCFLAVRLLGTDRIGHWEHVVVSTVKEWIKWPLSKDTQATIDGAVHEVETAVKETIPVAELGDHGEKRILEEDVTYVVVDHGYHEAKKANTGSNASLWTQLALAYAIHKSFIFIRVPLTAAVTPKVVKTLRSWGWNIGKMPSKKVAAGTPSSTSPAVNTKGSGVKSE